MLIHAALLSSEESSRRRVPKQRELFAFGFTQHFKSLFPIIVSLVFTIELLLTEVILCPKGTLLSTVLDYVLEQCFSTS